MKVSLFQGSPLGRSASPIDFVGSPHSPSTLGGTGPPGQQPQSQSVNYPDAMALAGQNYFMDLTNEVQKMTVVCISDCLSSFDKNLKNQPC